MTAALGDIEREIQTGAASCQIVLSLAVGIGFNCSAANQLGQGFARFAR